ncbi:MAG: S1 family peptidase [Methylovirgula sp.]
MFKGASITSLIRISLILVTMYFFGGIAQADEKPTVIPELNTILMESTYLIYGPTKGDPTKTSFGTAFLMGKPTPDKTKHYYVLITAAHVFDGINGDIATLKLREKQSDGSYRPKPWNIKIRENGIPLYVKPADADVAALYVNMPDDLGVKILPTALLADDDVLKKFELHPGDELFCLGFPLLVSSQAGFPILRSGTIASYPLVPTALNKGFYFDFRIFEGNSGGPVYFVDYGRTYGGRTHLGEIDQFVVGLVTSQLISKLYNNQRLELALVVPSSYILETIKLLPMESPYK